MLTLDDLLAQAPAQPDATLHYGEASNQFGQLFLPEAATGEPHPVVILVHGGCWRARVDLSYFTPAARQLAQTGVAVWNLEYRRVGNGGGWPQTFLDVAQGADYLTTLARTYPLDLSNTIAVGHSAGGHLAHWLAARPLLSKDDTLYRPHPLALRALISIAGIPDLAAALALGICQEMSAALLGGTPAEVPDRYRQGSPAELGALRLPQVFIQGQADDTVMLDYIQTYVMAAQQRGETVTLEVLEHTGHYDPVIAGTEQWHLVAQRIKQLLR